MIKGSNIAILLPLPHPATERLDGVAGLRMGVLLDRDLRRTGVRTKPGIDMGRLEESGRSRLS